MANWKYNPEDYHENGFGLIPEGNYRVRIESALEKVSRTGKDMIEITLAVSGYSSKIWFYLVFDSSNERMTQMTNQRLGSIYDSFGIEQGDMNLDNWEGKTGGARIRQRADNNGTMRSEVSYFLSRKKVDELPAWVEGRGGSAQTAAQDVAISDEVINPEMASFEDPDKNYGAGFFSRSSR